MDELTAFLKARWDDLERIAQDGKAACAHLDLCSDSGGEWWEHFGHENGPDLVLADIAAKRQILAEHAPADFTAYGDQLCRRCVWADDEPQKDSLHHWVIYPCLTLRLLAQPFAGHPDFREEWKA